MLYVSRGIIALPAQYNILIHSSQREVKMIYFDNAATSRFKPQCMFEAMIRECSESANPGRGTHADSIACAMRVAEARDGILALLGADETYAGVFTSGCTEALNLALFGLRDVLRGKAVVTTVTEHNSVLRPLNALAAEYGVNVRVASPSEGLSVTADDIAALVDDEVKLVAVNAVSNVTGVANDIQKICDLCASKGIWMLIDGAQALGHIRLSLSGKKGVMLAVAAHKGLHGPQGVGMLVFDRSIPLSPIRAGGTGTDSLNLVQPHDIPEGFESGTINAVGIAGMYASAKWTYANFDAINSRIASLSETACRGLSSIKGVKLVAQPRSGVISFTVSGYDSSEIADYLDDNNIAVRAGYHCAPLMHKFLGTADTGTVRVGIGFCNTPYHIEKLVRVMRLFVGR